jgi:hypothetical protein
MEWHEILGSCVCCDSDNAASVFLAQLPVLRRGCGVADGKPRTDPANEGTWVPSGTWRGVGGRDVELYRKPRR